MNIIKIGGSALNPDGKYDLKLVAELVEIVQKNKEKFLFVIGGGKICRFCQQACSSFFKKALIDQKAVDLANDEIGIAITKINANYVLKQFQEQLGEEVCAQIILDPTHKIKSDCRIFFAGGWKPGHSTDKDLMLLAETFKAEKVFKITNFAYVKDVPAIEIDKLSDAQRSKRLSSAKSIPKMSWTDLQKIVGKEWHAGMNTPFDPQAAEIGFRLRKELQLYFLRKEELAKAIEEKKFNGTIVKG